MQTQRRSPIHKMIALISADVLDPKTGRILERLEPRPANTFLQNWMKMQYCLFGNATVAGTVDTGGTARTMNQANNPRLMNAGAGVTTHGIVIGNQVGPAAVTLADNKLQAQVTANITHAAMVFSLNAPDASHYQLILSRQLTNVTGSTLNITEVALYINESGSGYFYCVDRTLLALSVANTLATTLTYTLNTNT
jgi:hypothetical protein